MIERLGLIAHAITNDEPFIGAEGVELHIRDPESVGFSRDESGEPVGRDDSFISEEGDDRRLSEMFAAPGDLSESSNRNGSNSPLREDHQSFSSSLAATRSLERMPTMIAAARAFAGAFPDNFICLSQVDLPPFPLRIAPTHS